MSTVIIALVVLAALFFVARKLFSDKKKGKSLCGGKCSSCPNGCACHSVNQDIKKNVK